MLSVRQPTASYMPRSELPPHLQSLFNPRPPLSFMKVPLKPKCRPYTGLADYLEFFEDKRVAEETVERGEEGEIVSSQMKPDFHPKENNIESEPFKTLFVCRLSYETTERRLQREFEVFGPLKSAKIVRDQQGKSRGYAFLEFEHLVDFKNAYKQANGKMIDGKKILVDIERGRTIEDWFPRRLGGGKGDTRAAKSKAVKKPKKEPKKEEKKEPKQEVRRSRSPRRRNDFRNNRPHNRDRDRDRHDFKRRRHDNRRRHDH